MTVSLVGMRWALAKCQRHLLDTGTCRGLKRVNRSEEVDMSHARPKERPAHRLVLYAEESHGLFGV